MTYPILPGKFGQLPEEVQKQVLEYIEFLIEKYSKDQKGDKYPLRGSVKSFESPFEPVVVNDWEAAQ
ncbi:MAG: DUF2281 domain-containing protein [Bacteroidia bacterium]